MKKPDALKHQLADIFSQFDIEKSRGGYNLLDRYNGVAIARLKPIRDTDRFELMYWSNNRGCWRTFGNLGRLKLTLDSAHDIVTTDRIFRVTRPWWRRLLGKNG